MSKNNQLNNNSMTIKTENQFREAADLYASEAVEVNKIKARQTAEIKNLQTRHKAELEERAKEQTSLRGKLGRFCKKYATKIFGGNHSGTIKTKIAQVTLRKTPDKIKPLDPKESESQLMESLRSNGFEDCIVKKETISKEALERLRDDELERVGFYRVSDYAFDIVPVADKTIKK